MNIPITARIKRSGKKSCGCDAGCKCGSVAKMADLSGDGKVTQKDVLIGRGVIEAPAKMSCYGKKK